MSQDPKKPFDAPPGSTPELLQKELPLDRRNRRVPTFEELRAVAPTEIERPAQPRSAPPQRPPAIPQSTVPASPRAIDSPPTVPIHVQRAPAPPRPAVSAPARPPAATPSQYPGNARPAPAPHPETNVLPHRPAVPADQARTIPPSPAEYARLRGQRPAPLPQVTAGVPSQGASIPPGQSSTPNRPQPIHTAPQHAPHENEPVTAPGGARPVAPAPPKPASSPAPAFRSVPSVLPPEMLVTQPGMPGPFADKKRLAYQPAPSAPAPQAPSAAPAPAPKGPSSLAEFAALADAPAPSDVFASPASLWRRLAAWLVDIALLGGVVTAMLVGAAQVIAGGLTAAKLPSIFIPAAMLTALLAFVYASLFAFIWGGRTPGRRALGLHLVDDTGHAPAPMRALLRGVLSLVSFALFLAGFWVALFDRRGQTLHDKLSSTFVVQLRDA